MDTTLILFVCVMLYGSLLCWLPARRNTEPQQAPNTESNTEPNTEPITEPQEELYEAEPQDIHLLQQDIQDITQINDAEIV
jgi:hypothetical protein